MAGGATPAERAEGAVKMSRWLAGLGVLALIAAACSSGPPQQTTGKVTLTWWQDSEDTGALEHNIISAFEKKHPNIQVQLTTYPETHYPTKVETAVAAGHAPDVVGFPSLTWMKEGLLLPLEGLVKKYHIDLSAYNPAIVGTNGQYNAAFGCAYGGKLYCLGAYLGSDMLLYNRSLFKAAGIATPPSWPAMTVDQFVNLACKLTNKSKHVYGAAYGDPFTWLPLSIFASPDGKKAEGYMNSPTTVQTEETLAKGIQQGCAPSLNTMDPWAQGEDWFVQGKLAMVIGGFLDMSRFEKLGINYGYAPYPAPVGVQPFWYTWTDGAGIMAKSPHIQQAEQFVAFLTTKGQEIGAKLGDLPLSSAVAKETNWAHGVPGREEGLQVLQHTIAPIFIPDQWGTYGPEFDAFGSIVGGANAQDTLNKAAAATQANLDKQWKIWEQS
jgi:multiple sugar transport system substrate-binding protein